MKKTQRINSFMKQLPVVVALFAAFVFSGNNEIRFLLTEEASRDQQVQKEQEQESERPAAYFEYACNALAPAAQLVFPHQPALKIPLLPLPVVQEKPLALPPLRVDGYFLTLFRLIISPNAP